MINVPLICVNIKLMAKPKKRLQALELRRRGMSIGTIAKTLGVSKGSVGPWCLSVVLTPIQRRRLQKLQIAAGHRGRILGAEMNRQKRLARIAYYEKEAEKLVAPFSKRDMLMLGIGLYWGEGVKSRSGSPAVVNSDPSLVLFAKRWFENCLGVKKEDFNPYIYISEHHRSRERKIMRFWSTLLQIPPSQFNRIIFLKGRPKKVYENHDSYYGVLTLRVRKGSELKYRVLGFIKACKDAAEVAQLVGADVS